jgi:hypothetical protein
MDAPNPVAGGSGTGNNAVVPPVQQNVVVNPAAQQAAAQLAQQILANTNVTLKQEIVKIPEFFGEKGKDTVTAQEFVTESMSVKSQMTGTTPQLLPTSAYAYEEKLMNGCLQQSDI